MVDGMTLVYSIAVQHADCIDAGLYNCAGLGACACGALLAKSRRGLLDKQNTRVSAGR